MQKLIALLLIVFIFGMPEAQAQIGGLSASKLSALNTETVPQFTIEFEPSFVFGYANRYWNRSGKSRPLFKNNDSLRVHSEMDFRFTYGLTPQWEAGFTLPTDVSYLSFGSKYRFFEKRNYSLAVLNGLNLPLGNHIYSAIYRHNKCSEYDINLLAGMAATYQFNQRFSVDFNSIVQGHLDRGFTHLANHIDLFLNTDFGYYLWQKFQGIIGFYYARTAPSRQTLTINPGFTIEKAKHFIMVLNFPYDAWGKNCEKQIGFSFALTIALD